MVRLHACVVESQNLTEMLCVSSSSQDEPCDGNARADHGKQKTQAPLDHLHARVPDVGTAAWYSK